MTSAELVEMLDLLLSSVATISSEDDKTTVLDDVKPSSFEYIIKSTINFLEGDFE